MWYADLPALLDPNTGWGTLSLLRQNAATADVRR
jgi:hypothetical protein